MDDIERKALVELSIKRLAAQIKDIDIDIRRDTSFIEEKMEMLPKIMTPDTKKGVERQVAERMNRVDNLRKTVQMITLCLELLDKEQQRLKRGGQLTFTDN